MFRKPVNTIKQGDRAGICVPQLDADLIERGIAATPRSIKSSDLAIVLIQRIPYFLSGEVKTKSKYHISIGHQTGIGVITLFSCQSTQKAFNFSKNSLKTGNNQAEQFSFAFTREYQSEEVLPNPKKSAQQEETKGNEPADIAKDYYAIIKFEKEVLAQEQTLLIGSKLDTDTSLKTCRLAFYGQVLVLLPHSQSQEERQQFLQQITIIKDKVKFGKVDKVVDN